MYIFSNENLFVGAQDGTQIKEKRKQKMGKEKLWRRKKA